jgi:hypothetical protein
MSKGGIREFLNALAQSGGEATIKSLISSGTLGNINSAKVR